MTRLDMTLGAVGVIFGFTTIAFITLLIFFYKFKDHYEYSRQD